MSQPVDINQAIAVRTSLKVLNPGMYAVHYVEAGQHAPNIPLSLSQAPIRMGGEIEFICPEGITQQTLAAPGEYLVVNVRRGQAVLAVSKYAPSPLVDKVASRWRIESLGSARHIPDTPKQESSAQPMLPLSMTGHIERRGDVTVTAGQWLGDPDSRARLEGFSLEWPQQPEGVDITAACWVGNQKIEGSVGQFVGTRRRAAPIRQVALRLSGSNAGRYQLSGEAAFSDGSRQSISGQPAAAASPEAHLVALSLSVSAVDQSAFSANEKAAEASQSAWLDPGITQISSSRA